MQAESFFFQALVYLAAAVVAVPVAKRLGLGSVLGYILAGVVIGPFGLALIGEEGKDVMHFAEFGVVLMLFIVGLELQPSLLWRMRGPILGIGGLQVVATSVVILAIGLAVGLPWNTALAIGMILALSSTAIVLQTLNEKGLMKTDAGQSAFSVLLFQDIAVIPMLALLPLLAVSSVSGAGSAEAAHHGSAWIKSLPVWGQTLVVLGAVVMIIAVGRYLSRPVFRFIAKTGMREIFTATALLLVIGVTVLMSQIDLSPALGTFVAGVVLAGSEYRHELESDIDPFKGLLLGLFFISVGAAIDFGLIIRQPLLIAAITAALIVVKFAVLWSLGRCFRMGTDNGMLFAFALAQGGEFAFVLFSFAAQHAVLHPSVVQPLVAAVAVSMAATPLLMLINEKLIQPRYGTKTEEAAQPDRIREENRVIVAGFGRFGNIVGRFLQANGIRATFLDLDADNVEVLRKLGIKVFYGDTSRLDLLEAAGAAHAELLILAIDDHHKIREIVDLVRKHYPDLAIMARANSRIEAYELLESGVAHVYRETFDTSLRMAIEALRLLGVHPYHAHRMARLFRKKDEDDLRELSRMRHDRKAYLTSARERISDLERLLLEEAQGHDETRDIGWDTTTLREDIAKMSASE